MAREPTRDRSGTSVELKPVGADGLEMTLAPAMLSPGSMQVARNVDTSEGTYGSRWGDVKIARFIDTADTYGAKVFGTTARYATMPVPLISKGGFGVMWHFTATRPAASEVRYLWDSGQSAAWATRVIWATFGWNGLLNVLLRWGDNTQVDIQGTIATDGSEAHCLLIYNPKAGTLTLYVNGEVFGTPITGLSPELQPYQSIAYPWYLAASFNPGTGVVANSGHQAALDAFTIFSFKGIEDITDEDLTLDLPRKSLLTELRERTFQDWPNPASPMVLVQYGMDEATVGTGPLYDSSDAKRHGTYFGSPTNAAQVARRAQCGQFLGTTKRASVGNLEDGLVNMAICGGSVFTETLKAGY